MIVLKMYHNITHNMPTVCLVFYEVYILVLCSCICKLLLHKCVQVLVDHPFGGETIL